MSTVRNIISKLVVVTAAVAFVGLALPERGTAQFGWGDPKGEVFGYLDLGVPIGDFRSHVDLGGGAGGGGVLFLGENRLAGLRAEGSFLIYGAERWTVPFSNTVSFVDLEQETTNAILSAGLGPQVYLGTGKIRPYFYGTVGFSAFVTSTSVSGMYEQETIASTTNHSDFRLAFTGGGGLSVQMRGGPNPLSLDLSAAYRYNGVTEYLANGTDNLERLRRGGWVANPIRSEANLMTYRVGISAGVG
ncbi:MAG: hypothetical protein F4123_05405 [Gemmatimonadetes bacterium]|nr:hypothetical protein [Gemmatimonadota bacterium]MYC00114.1 hypothetical protein [Gemmatimonadota bacterium]MYI45801.1 hypothetical protein [Gemmatimonadota bacterium]